MNFEKIKKLITGFLFLSVLFAIDRITKIIILNIAEKKGEVDIYVNSYLNLFLVWNQGIGFGLLSFDEKYIYHLVTLLIFIINLIIIYIIFREKGYKVYLFLMILGGSLGNLFDRIYYNAVPDFIDLNYKGFHWFIFNAADIFITFGIVCLIITEFLKYKKIK
tara:strand:+ start:2430 stop:2918 length:489 start_codon:yes stop_codon:yes gene_type:complete